MSSYLLRLSVPRLWGRVSDARSLAADCHIAATRGFPRLMLTQKVQSMAPTRAAVQGGACYWGGRQPFPCMQQAVASTSGRGLHNVQPCSCGVPRPCTSTTKQQQGVEGVVKSTTDEGRATPRLGARRASSQSMADHRHGAHGYSSQALLQTMSALAVDNGSPHLAGGLRTAGLLSNAAAQLQTRSLPAYEVHLEDEISAERSCRRDWLAGVASTGVSAPQSAPLTAVAGTVQRITFRAADTGYSVLRVKADKDSKLPSPAFLPGQAGPRKDRRRSTDTVTVVGVLPQLCVGQSLRFHGYALLLARLSVPALCLPLRVRMSAACVRRVMQGVGAAQELWLPISGEQRRQCGGRRW